MVGYIIWSAAIIGAIGAVTGTGFLINLLLTKLGGGRYYNNWWQYAIMWSYVFLVAAVGFGLTAWAIAEGEKPPKGFVEWPAGKGPATVCRYVVKDDDSTVMAGKVPVHVEDSDIYTRCETGRLK